MASFNLTAEDLDAVKITKLPVIGDELELPIAQQHLVFNEENGIFYIPLSLKGKSTIEILITKGSDNTGDKGMTWKLCDSALKEVYGTGAAKKEKRQKWVVKDIRTSNPVLVLEDKDAKFSVKWPGNGCDIEVRFPN